MTRVILQSPCGGTGKSTVAANLALTLARNGNPVLLEGDVDGGLSTHFTEWSPDFDAHSAPRGFEGRRKRQVEPNLYIDDSQRAPTLATALPARWDEVSANRGGPTRREYTIVDSDALVLPTSEFLNRADWLIYVVNADARSLHRIAQLFGTFAPPEQHRSCARYLFLMNRFRPESELCRDILELFRESTHRKLYVEPLLDDASVEEASASGLPLAEYAPYSPVHQALQGIANLLQQQGDERYVAA